MKHTLQMEESPVLQFLQNPDRHYLSATMPGKVPAGDFEDNDIVLYQVKEITFDDKDKAPRKEALENVLSAVRIPGINFLYLIAGSPEGVRFYYGLSRASDAETRTKLNLVEIGNSILKSSLEGNFRGCKVELVDPTPKNNIIQKMRGMRYADRIEGVAGTIKDNEAFQSADRLVDVMRGDSFCLLIVAESIRPEEIARIEQNLQKAYSDLSSYAKWSLQDGRNEGTSESHTDGKNWSNSQSGGSSGSYSHGESTSTNKSETTNATKKSTSEGGGEGSSKSWQDGWNMSHQRSKGHSSSEQQGSSKGSSQSLSREYLNKCAQEWIKYCDDVLFPRLDYGRGKGLFMTAFYVMSSSRSSQTKLTNTALSLYSGKMGNRVPLRNFRIGDDPYSRGQRQSMERCQIPDCVVSDEEPGRAFLSQDVRPGVRSPMSNWISTNELSLIAGLPQKEVIGMRLQEQVEFGLNYTKPEENDSINLGCLVQDGLEVEKTPVCLQKSSLDKHVFVAGVTGSGKTTTCQRLLLQSGLPFLVIEPAKTEYRILKRQPSCKDLLVFTLGDDTTAPFRLNPFEFMKKESITAHVDMIKASMEAAFEMQAAEPQLIEAALYKAYEKKGWNIELNQNRLYRDPFAPNVDAFPTFSDLLERVKEVVSEQGFDERLQKEYTGSILAMLQSLTLGSKGTMLNTPRSINIDALLDKKVVLELENIRSGNEKALIMGFILSAFNEAVRERFIETGKEHAHVMLVEEAHRLLSRYEPGDSLNKKQGVETFSDMLAEIRKYGESLIIVDQIPNKMAPDVLKNTNTKIIHRIFAQDDKEAVGNTMALNADQKRFLSSLPTGRAVVFSDGYEEALLAKITDQTNTSSAPLKDRELMERAMEYYEKCEQKFFLPLPEGIGRISDEQFKRVMQFIVANVPCQMICDYRDRKPQKVQGYDESFAKIWRDVLQTGVFTPEILANLIAEKYHANEAQRKALVFFYQIYGTAEHDEAVSAWEGYSMDEGYLNFGEGR